LFINSTEKKIIGAGQTYNLLDDFAGGMQVDKAFVDFKLVAIPGL
jgi:hypothetical protein